jgi:hypothetical protein
VTSGWPTTKLVGGFPTGRDGRVHGTFTHNPSTLRLSLVDPNLQTIPRGTDLEAQRWVKECFVAPKGSMFWSRDYSGIEAVLVGYFAGSPTYIRAATLGVHAFLTSHLTKHPADWSWSDEDLKAYFATVKKEHRAVYETAKRCVHGSNYMMTPRKMWLEYPETFSTVSEASKLQGLYFDLFPEISQWHKDLCHQVDGTTPQEVDISQATWSAGVCQVWNPFGYLHRFYNVIEWERIEDTWYSSFGEDAKRLIAFLPQSTAAAIIKKAGARLWYDYPQVGRSMRLWIHDEILGEAPVKDIEECLTVSREVMEEPHTELPLDPAYGLGTYLQIGTEAKVGSSWATMQ